jgi:hypothetical protein
MVIIELCFEIKYIHHTYLNLRDLIFVNLFDILKSDERILIEILLLLNC